MLVRERRPLRTLQGNSEQLALIMHRLIEQCLHAFHSTLQLRDVKAADLGREQLVRDVERGHDRDALVPDHLAGVADLAFRRGEPKIDGMSASGSAAGVSPDAVAPPGVDSASSLCGLNGGIFAERSETVSERLPAMRTKGRTRTTSWLPTRLMVETRMT